MQRLSASDHDGAGSDRRTRDESDAVREARARAERERDSAKPQGKGEALTSNAEIARQLLAIMDRELAKNATMTIPYGVTLRRIYKELCKKGVILGLKDAEKCAMYLTKLLVECIPEVAVEAGRIMEWLREVAGIIAKQNRGMMWTTPIGFVVLHENRKPKAVRLATADHMIKVHQDDDKR